MSGVNQYSRRSGYLCPGCGGALKPRKVHHKSNGKRVVVSTVTLCVKCQSTNPVIRRKRSYKAEADAIQARLEARRAARDSGQTGRLAT